MTKRIILAVGIGVVGIAAAAQAIVVNQPGGQVNGASIATTAPGVAVAPGSGASGSGDKPCTGKCPFSH